MTPGTGVLFTLTGQPGMFLRDIDGKARVVLYDREGRGPTGEATLFYSQLQLHPQFDNKLPLD